jgi:hypothetical protein
MMENSYRKANQITLKIIIISYLFLLYTLILNVTPAMACSCFPVRSPEEEMNDSTAVFSGQVIQIEGPDPLGGMVSTVDQLTVTFAVYEIWKGPQINPLIIQTARDSATCGYHFEVGQDYLVYAHGNSSNLQTNICTRTSLLANANEDIQAIGSGVAAPPLEQESNFVSRDWLLIISILLLVVALVAFSIVVIHRQKSKDMLS